MLRQLCSVLFSCALVQYNVVSLDTIDTVEPIIRSAPQELDSYGYFGFSAVLHRTNVENLNTFSDYLASTR